MVGRKTKQKIDYVECQCYKKIIFLVYRNMCAKNDTVSAVKTIKNR